MEKKSKQREKKERIVAELGEKARRATSLIFTNYQGLTHIQLEQLKKNIKASQAELVVTKNTLLARALQISNFKFQISNLERPTATLFAYGDVLAPLKELARTIKKLNLPTIKFGIFDGRMLAENDVIRLSTLPPKEVLLAQLVATMQAPIRNLAYVLNWNLQRLVVALKAVEAKKE